MPMIDHIPAHVRQELIACVTMDAFDQARFKKIVADNGMTPIGRDLIQEAYNIAIGAVLEQEQQQRTAG
jgi:hypothetical protein